VSEDGEKEIEKFQSCDASLREQTPSLLTLPTSKCKRTQSALAVTTVVSSASSMPPKS